MEFEPSIRHPVSMEDGAANDIVARAEVRLLPASQGGRTGPVRGSYRPNHNFFGADNRDMTMGVIDLPADTELHPGQSIEVTIAFIGWPGLAGQVYPGRQWRIQEGPRL